MKNIFLTLATILTIGFVSSCSKEPNTNTNHQAVQLTATQMTLLGTTNPTDANASATWIWDSTIFVSGSNDYDTTGYMKYTFTTDSLSIYSGVSLTATHSYSFTNDSTVFYDNQNTCTSKNVIHTTTTNLTMKYFNTDCSDNRTAYFHKQ